MIYKRNGIYWFDASVDGRRLRKSLHTKNKKQAEQMHDKLKAELWEKEYLGKEIKTWEDAIGKWVHTKKNKKSLHKDVTIIEFFSQFFAGSKLTEIDIEKAIVVKEREGVSPATVNRYIAFIRSLVNEAKKVWNWEVPKITRQLTKEKPRERFLEKTETERLMMALPDKLKPVVTFAIETGLRKSSILAITRKAVDLEAKTLTLEGELMKSGKPISIPLTDKAIKALEDSNYDFTFNNRDYYLFRLAAKEAGLSDIRFHDLRHTFATNLAKRGVPLDIIGKLLGHSDLRSTERYRHLCVEDLRQYV